MRFRRDWRVICRDYFGTFILIFLLLLWTIFIPEIKSGEPLKSILEDLSVFFTFAFVCFSCYYFAGDLSIMIELSDKSIIYQDKGIIFQKRKLSPLQIYWEDIDKIIRTRYIGGKAIVFRDKYGQEIWFYNSKRIENYILSHHPELKPMFPLKRDYRKWQQWDVKLPF